MKDMNWGALGAWQPPFDLGQAFCLHIKVPRFSEAKRGDRERAMNEIYDACIGNGKAHAWFAKADIHCSDKDGQRREDWQRHMCGTHVMIKFMVCAHEQMMELFEIAKTSATPSPHNHKQEAWQVRLCKDTRMTPLTTTTQEDKPTIFTNGVELQVPQDVGHRQEQTFSEAGVRSFTSIQTSQQINDLVAGTSQALVLPMPQYLCQHNQVSVGESLSCFMSLCVVVVCLVC